MRTSVTIFLSVVKNMAPPPQVMGESIWAVREWFLQLSPASMTPSLASRTPSPASKTHSPASKTFSLDSKRRLVWPPRRLVRPSKSSKIIEESIFRVFGSLQELLESSRGFWNQFGLSGNGLCSLVQLPKRQVQPPRRIV